MNLAWLRILMVWCCFSVCIQTVGQEVILPGDASNNGLVNNIDIIYTGYAFGAVGPARVQEDTEATPQAVAQLWDQSYPDDTNFAYADANGNGLVDWLDLLAIYQNYGATLPPVSPDPFPPSDSEKAADLLWRSDGTADTAVPGSLLRIPLYWEPTTDIVEVNGLAFSITFDSALVSDIFFEWAENFLNADSSWYSQQRLVREGPDRLEIAATRLGNDPASGLGLLGHLNIIVEDDLIGLLYTPQDSINTIMNIRRIFGVGRDFAPLTVGEDAYPIIIRHPDWRQPPTGTDIALYPNPSRGWVTVDAGADIEAICIYDMTGRQLLQHSGMSGRQYRFSVAGLPTGWLLVAVHSGRQVSYRRLLVD